MIYLDHNATTPLVPEALEAMTRVARETWGNPSSLHARGREARKVVEEARERIAAEVSCEPHELVFTSGGTEACNHAVLGAMRARQAHGRHLAISALEHPAVKAAARDWEEAGGRLTWISPNADGVVEPGAVQEALQSDTMLCAVMAANNEVGTLQPVLEIGTLLRERGVWFFSDAVQALGKTSLDLRATPVDMAAFAAHKIGGPKGIGALYARKGIKLDPGIRGGGQERGLRGGTENVPGIAGFAAAVDVWRERGEAERRRLAELRDALAQDLREKIPSMTVNAGDVARLPNTLHATFPGCRGDLLVMALDLRGIAVSAGSACASGSVKPSEVLLAMGRSPEAAVSSLRFSLGWSNSWEEIPQISQALAETCRAISAAV